MVELHLVHAHQPHQRIARQDVEVDVGQGLQVLHPPHAGHHGQEETQLGDFAGLFHDVHAVQVVGDNAALDVVAHAGVVFLDAGQPRFQLGASAHFGAAHHGVIHVDEALERGHQKGARAHGRVENGDAGQHFAHQLQGGARVHLGEQVRHAVELHLFQTQLGHGGLVDALQDQLVDAALGQVAGDFGPGVVGAKGFLVDVLLEDVAQHVGVDLVGVAAGRVVQVPGEAGKEVEDAFKRSIGHAQGGAHARGVVGVQLQLVVQEQAAVQVGHLAGEGFGCGAAVGLGFGEGFKKQGVTELAKKTVFAAHLALGQLGAQVVGVAAVQEEFLLHEPDEHEPVEQHAGVPAFVAFVVNALDVAEQLQVLLLVGSKKLLGGFVHVQRGLDAARRFQHGQAARGVQLGQFDHHGLQLGSEQIDRLAFEIVVAARGEAGLAGFGVLVAFDPVPLALAGAGWLVGEDEQVFGVAVGHVFPHLPALVFVGPAAVHHHLDGDHAAQFGHGAVAVGSVACLVSLPVALSAGHVPAQHVHKQALKVEGLEVLFKGGEVELGHGSNVDIRREILSLMA